MTRPLDDAKHLVRMAGLFVVGAVVFLILRSILTPADFGELGHYRTGALDDNRSVEPRYAGREMCADCHDAATDELAVGTHLEIGCEACHGPLGEHASDPESAVPDVLEVRSLCISCHLEAGAKPEWFPQVEPADHAGDESCDACHAPHQPGV